MVKAIIERMKVRSEAGWIKYRATLARTDITEHGWIKHAQEEALDLIAYLEAIVWHHGDNDALHDMQEQVLAIATILECALQSPPAQE